MRIASKMWRGLAVSVAALVLSGGSVLAQQEVKLGAFVTLSGISADTVTVAYATSDGTAQAGIDYQAASGTLTFLPGETSKTVPVSLYQDLLAEDDETLLLTLSNPTGASIGRGLAVGTIREKKVERPWRPHTSRPQACLDHLGGAGEAFS